jgi:hypothetical protein
MSFGREFRDAVDDRISFNTRNILAHRQRHDVVRTSFTQIALTI